MVVLLKKNMPCNVNINVNLKSGIPLAVLSPAPAITTIFWAPSTTDESYCNVKSIGDFKDQPWAILSMS